MVGTDDPAQLLGIEPRGQRRRADQIAEHHGEVPTLRFSSGNEGRADRRFGLFRG
jgi:hypothetical protein